jgi:hypothetical protein
MNGFSVDGNTLPDLPGTALDLAFNQNTGIGLTYMRMGVAPDGSLQGPGGFGWTLDERPSRDRAWSPRLATG